MAIDVYYANSPKRRNSTKQATFSESNKYSCVLKEETSLDHPTFLFEGNWIGWNVAKWGDRYYFIEDVRTVRNGLWEVDCVLDVLATYKSAITSSTQLIARCADSYNGHIIDDAYPALTNPSIYYDADTPVDGSHNPIFRTDSSMACVLTIKGPTGSGHIVMKAGLFGELGAALFAESQDDLWSALTTPALFSKTYLDPFQYVVGAKLIPISEASISGTQSSTIQLGYWSYTDPDGVAIFKTPSSKILYTGSVHLYPHDHTSPHSADLQFLKSNRFRKFNLTLPGAGCMELDADIVPDGGIDVSFTVDVIGKITYNISCGNARYLQSGNIGADMAIHGQNVNFQSIISSGMQVVSGALAGAGSGALAGSVGNIPGAAIGAVAGAAIGATRAIASAQPLAVTRTNGTDGSLSEIASNRNIILTEVQYSISNRAPITLGYPYMQYSQIGNHSGYVLCENAHVSADANARELDAIDSYLNSGFFVE